MNPQQDIICSILGLSDDVSSYLKVINPEYKDHNTVHSWIEDFMGSKRIAIMDNQSIVDQLLGLGFIPAKARALANQIEVNEYSGHQDHIKSQFSYNILLAGKPHESTTNTCNQGGEYGQAFNIPTCEEENAIGVKAVHFSLQTKSELDNIPKLVEFAAEQENTLKGSRFWFRGTDACSANRIIRDGINLSRSSRPTDFTDHGGFYLWKKSWSNSFESDNFIYQQPYICLQANAWEWNRCSSA